MKVTRTELGDWESYPFTVYFERSLSDPEKTEFELLVRSWFLLGSWGGFEGHMHFLSPIHFDDDENLAEWYVDMGTCPPIALEILERGLHTSSEEVAPITELVLGTIVEG